MLVESIVIETTGLLVPYILMNDPCKNENKYKNVDPVTVSVWLVPQPSK